MEWKLQSKQLATLATPAAGAMLIMLALPGLSTSLAAPAPRQAMGAMDMLDPEPGQGRRSGGRTTEQTIETTGTVSRQGKEWVEEITGSLPAASVVRVNSFGGNIAVRGAAQQDITYRIRKRVPTANEQSARRLLSAVTLQVRRGGDSVELSMRSPGQGQGVQADYEVTVPKNTAALDLATRGGNITAAETGGTFKAFTAGGGIESDGIGGAADLETAGGSITMRAMAGSVRARTAGGNIKLGSAGGEVDLATAGGNVYVGRAEKNVTAASAGGNISIGVAGGDVTAQTAGGTVTVGEARRVNAETAGGSIQVDLARVLVKAQTAGGSIRLAKCIGPLHVETAAGSITASIASGRQEWAESVLDTSGGDIIVYLPAKLALTIRAAIERASTRHQIISDFPLNIRTTQAAGPREVTGEGPVNGGGPSLRLRTVAGNIEIRRVKE